MWLPVHDLCQWVWCNSLMNHAGCWHSQSQHTHTHTSSVGQKNLERKKNPFSSLVSTYSLWLCFIGTYQLVVGVASTLTIIKIGINIYFRPWSNKGRTASTSINTSGQTASSGKFNEFIALEWNEICIYSLWSNGQVSVCLCNVHGLGGWSVYCPFSCPTRVTEQKKNVRLG